MALIGGGGAGNVAGGANPSGVGTSLNYIGDHCYAYSGKVPSSATAFNLLDFTTGNSYVLADLTCFYAVQGSGSDMQFAVKLNGTVIGQFNLTDSNDLTEFPVPFLIPSYSRFEVEQDNLASGTEPVAASIVGRVYE
jgi:hypothetical protein|tara:strand:- start:156 stop:566 length:411 start_codon:yes stop_codon:yes gene_type:complete